MASQITRRGFLRVFGVASGAAVLAACAPKPASQPAPAGSAPTAVSKKEAPAPVKDKVQVRVASWEFADRTFMKDAANEYNEMRDDLDIEVEVWVYNEAMKKTLTGLATDNLPDVFFAHVRWAQYIAYKGAVLALDDLVEQSDPEQGFVEDFYPAALAAPTFEGKLYGLPIEMNAGGVAVAGYNKELLAKNDVPEPTDDWTTDDFIEIANKVQDRDNKIFGTVFQPRSFHYWASDARTFGSDALTPDGKGVLFNEDPKSIAAARWIWSMRNEFDAAAQRDEMEGLSFQAGRVGVDRFGVQSVSSVLAGIGDRFEIGIVITPHGPDGNRGYFTGVSSMLLASNTKNPQEAFETAAHIASKEWSERAFVEQGQPPARKSVWAKSEQLDVHPIWKRVGDWMLDEAIPGNFPMPYNLRYNELNSKFTNSHLALWYGDVPFEEGMQMIHNELESIVKLPRE